MRWLYGDGYVDMMTPPLDLPLALPSDDTLSSTCTNDDLPCDDCVIDYVLEISVLDMTCCI